MFQDGSGGRLTNSLQTLSTRPRLAPPVQESSRQARLPSPRQSNSPGKRGSHQDQCGRSSAPRRLATQVYNSPTPMKGSNLPSPRACGRRDAGRSALLAESAHGGARRSAAPGSDKDPKRTTPPAAHRAEFHEPTLQIHPFTSERFHVLLNSLFKVLFNFPSRYLSAIGLVPVFSLRWSLPPA